MTKNKDISTSSAEIKPHLLHLLYSQKKMHRSCTTNMAYDYIAGELGLTSSERELLYPDGRNKWQIWVQAAKAGLKKRGFVSDEKIEGMKNRSIWSITEAGIAHYEQNI